MTDVWAEDINDPCMLHEDKTRLEMYIFYSTLDSLLLHYISIHFVLISGCPIVAYVTTALKTLISSLHIFRCENRKHFLKSPYIIILISPLNQHQKKVV